MSQQHEDGPPMTPSIPVPDELQQLEPERRETMVPAATEVNAKMVALSLSSMATTLERIQESVAPVSALVSAVQSLERQHEVTLAGLEAARGTANLAGGLAGDARDVAEATRSDVRMMANVVDRIEAAVGRLAQSIQGIDERTKSIYQTVFPERSNGNGHDHDPEIEYGELVPFRRGSMTGE